MIRGRLILLSLLVAVAVVASSRTTSGRPPVQSDQPGFHRTPTGLMRFDFEDPKGVNAIGFFVDSELEPIMGHASGIRGHIDYDPDRPETMRGAIAFGADRIPCSNPRMSRVLAGAEWMHVDEHERVMFNMLEITKVERIDEHTARLQVKGKLGVRGIMIDKDVEVTATYVPVGAIRRGGRNFGDLVVLRSRFTIDRTDFGLKPEGPFDKVGREVQVNVAIAGYSK